MRLIPTIPPSIYITIFKRGFRQNLEVFYASRQLNLLEHNDLQNLADFPIYGNSVSVYRSDAMKQGRDYKDGLAVVLGSLTSHRNFSCRGCLSTRGLFRLFQVPPPAIPTHLQPAPRSEAPLSVLKV